MKRDPKADTGRSEYPESTIVACGSGYWFCFREKEWGDGACLAWCWFAILLLPTSGVPKMALQRPKSGRFAEGTMRKVFLHMFQ